MDASTFKTARDSQLKSFQTQYAALKLQYNAMLKNALTDQKNIPKVLDINKQITALINAFTGTVSIDTCNDNPKLKDQLNSDLAKYSSDYENIQQGTSKLTGLNDAINTANTQAEETKSWFSWYNGFIILAMIVLIYVIVTRSSSSTLNTQPSVSVFSGGL
jgi:hypothetical protein